MIRRGVLTSAAVTGVFLTTGALTAPDRPLPGSPPATNSIVQPVTVERPSGPALAWPEPQPDNPTLVWPNSGCDAGMWSVSHDVNRVEPTRTTIRALNHRGEVSEFDAYHGPDWDLTFYPVAPDASWVLTTDPIGPRFRLGRYEANRIDCAIEHELPGNEPAESRATVTSDGVTVYSRNDTAWSAVQFDNQCQPIAQRTLPAALAAPAEHRFGRAAATLDHDMRVAFVGDRELIIDSPAFLAAEISLRSELLLQKYGWGRSEDGELWIVYWDDETTNIGVFAPDGQVRFWEKWITHPYLDPVTHVSLDDGYLSLRGPLNAYPSNTPTVRIYDTYTAEIVAHETVEQLDPTRPWSTGRDRIRAYDIADRP